MPVLVLEGPVKRRAHEVGIKKNFKDHKERFVESWN